MTKVAREPAVEELLGRIKVLDKAADAEAWRRSLTPRKLEEAEFHDWTHGPELEAPESVATWEDEHRNMRFYAADHESARHREEWIQRNAPGNVFLDYACGRGTLTLLAAEAQASLAVGIDISPESVKQGRRRAARKGLEENTYFMLGDCENTGLPSNSIDRVITAGCLHHMDLSYVFPELRRILKPGGRVYAVEPLAYNPLIQLYRRLTPEYRTDFEKDHILTMKDLRFAKRFFDVENVRFFHLLSIATTPLRNTPLFNGALTVANALDRVLLRVPPIRYFAWSFAFELVKRNET